MKKFLASLLAVSMVASMSAVSFAAAEPADPDKEPTGMFGEVIGKDDGTTPEDSYVDQIKDGKYDKEDGYPLFTTLIGPFGYDNDDKYLTVESVEFGKTAYFMLTNLEPKNANKPLKNGEVNIESIEDAEDGDAVIKLVTNSDTASNLKLKTDWEEGKDLAKDLTIVKRKVMNVGWYEHVDTDKDDIFYEHSVALPLLESYGFEKEENKYYYMLAVNIGDSSSTSDADIIGDLTISRSKKPKADDHKYGIEINVDWENSFRKPNSQLNLNNVHDDLPGLLAETYYSVKFDGDEEIEIEFEDESTFTVDISGQGKVLLYYDTEHVSKIASKYPLAELNFWNGNGAKFNRTGEFFLRVGDDAEDYAQYLYQVNADGTLSEVPGAEYDDGDGGFYFKTRTLGTYVYSDMELEVSSSKVEDDKDDVVAPPVTPVTPVAPINPGTGAKA